MNGKDTNNDTISLGNAGVLGGNIIRAEGETGVIRYTYDAGGKLAASTALMGVK
ncbi:MAG: hypothetical protein LBS37_05685 [Treponema sp.]|nr:hypothetical protein [Treponema sp.]